MVELHRSIHAVSRASGEPWHRAKAAMLVANAASEARSLHQLYHEVAMARRAAGEEGPGGEVPLNRVARTA